MPYLKKQELWDEYGFVDSEEFEIELSEIFSEDGYNSSICVGHAAYLYEFLGGDKDLLKEYLSKLEKNKFKQKDKDKEIIEKEEDIENDEINNKDNIEEDNNEEDDEKNEESDYNNDDDEQLITY